MLTYIYSDSGIHIFIILENDKLFFILLDHNYLLALSSAYVWMKLGIKLKVCIKRVLNLLGNKSAAYIRKIN